MATPRIRSPEAADRRREQDRERKRQRRATPEGQAAEYAAKKRYYAKDEAKAVAAASRAKPEAKARTKTYNAAYYAANREALKAKVRTYTLRSEYNLEPGDFERMVEVQQGKCGLCGEVPDHILRVDHDHTTGAVRALLCARCNSGLGFFGDSAEQLRRAADYIERHAARGA